ncbi:VOC family protein [Streptomyces sp. NPDC091377]|uniref:VOC family protein n=1 Tax=Streptomyces sp. NPDC091377 TaxID=3365995 RepID=UPI0038155B30
MISTHFVTGAPNWVDLGTPDIDRATAFYSALFGWRLQSAGPESGGYGFFQRDGRTVAGAMQTPPDQGPPVWTVYFQSPDADATAEAVGRAHGRVVSAPREVPDKGRVALLADRAGAPYGIWQPGRLKGLDVVGEHGTLVWAELHTPDIAAAAGFYNTVFGWETSSVSFPGGSYTCVNAAGQGEAAAFGGLVPLDDDPVESDAEPHWLPYFGTADPDTVCARATELGGTVRLAPLDLPDVGRIAKLSDPFGARFAVIRGEPRQTG